VLWLALQFPRLTVDLAIRGHDTCSDEPALITEDELQLLPRDVAAEQEALLRLAGWCYQFSSQVTIIPDRTALVLEVGASEKLFGAPESLAEELRDELRKLGYQARTGTAPTPEAAHLAARHGLHITKTSEIPQHIRKLPIDSLELDLSRGSALQKMGFRSIGEVLKLPRKALARRMGPATVDYLDRLTGALPDPQLPWQPPEHFSTAIDLVAEISNSQALLFPLNRMISELCGVLRARDRGILELHICLQLDNRKGEPEREELRLGLQQATRDEARILLLLRERLERLRLPRPVRCISLQAGQLLPFGAEQDSLFRNDPDIAEQPVHPLLERLRARLGSDAVSGLKGMQDHRPEYSWSVRELDEPADCTAMPHRPIWLFDTPQRCTIGEYEVLAGPERIEAGWWDGHDCRRDYFVVRDHSGCTLWAFREYKPEPGWYLQGMFA
jgi:protein ImuB